jgi:hypothetical protein
MDGQGGERFIDDRSEAFFTRVSVLQVLVTPGHMDIGGRTRAASAYALVVAKTSE